MVYEVTHGTYFFPEPLLSSSHQKTNRWWWWHKREMRVPLI